MDRRILIIDDDEDDVRFLKDALHKKGFANVELCHSTEAALSYMENNMQKLPHLILTDIKMPITSGLDFIWALKSKSAFKDIPIIAFSSVAEISYKDKALSAGAINFISKPLTATEYDKFVTKISEIIL